MHQFDYILFQNQLAILMAAAFDAAACGSGNVSIGEVDLQQPLPLIERYGSTAEALRCRSVRSMSADAGAVHKTAG